MTIGSPGLGNESPLRGPKLPHGLRALPGLFAVLSPCIRTGRFYTVLPQKKLPSFPEKNPPGIINSFQEVLYK